jgi:hypothetical protein
METKMAAAQIAGWQMCPAGVPNLQRGDTLIALPGFVSVQSYNSSGYPHPAMALSSGRGNSGKCRDTMPAA